LDERKPSPLHAVDVPRGPQPRLAFGPFVLDPETGTLSEGDRLIPLAPKPFDTLLYLARGAGRVVGKRELMDRLWADTFVTDDVLVQCVVEIRRALGDQAKESRYLQTLPRRGYRFLPEVQTLAPGAPQPPAQAPPALPPPVVPRRSRRVVAAATAGVLLLAGLAALPVLRRGPPAEAPVELVAEPGSVVVLPVRVQEDAAQSDWLRQGLAEMIRAQLGQKPGLHVVARHRLAAALGEAGVHEDQAPSAAVASGLARRLQAERLVTGSFVRVEDRFVMRAEVVDVASGRGVGSASAEGRYPTDLLDAVDRLCLQLIGHLGPERRADAAAWQPSSLATRSVEASRAYVEALAAFERGGRRGAEEAEAHLDHALALDPSFAQAYVKKAHIQHWRQRWAYGDPDPSEALRAAVRRMASLPDRDRLLVKGFEDLILRQQPAEAVSEWNKLLQLYPTYAQEAGVPGLIAETYRTLGRWDDLILMGGAQVGAPSLPTAERAQLHGLLAQAFRRKGELTQALDHASEAVRLWPFKDGPEYLKQRTYRGRMALEAGRQPEALAEFRAVAAAPDADVVGATEAAWGLYMAGRAPEAAAVLERAIALDPQYGNAYHLQGWLRLADGHAAEAAERLLLAFERTPRAFGYPHVGVVGGDLAALYYAGVAWDKAGEPGRAHAAFTRLVEHCRGLEARLGEASSARWQAENFLARAEARLGRPVAEPARLAGDDTTYFVQTARLHAVMGRREQALGELVQGLTLGHGELRHIGDDPDFESLRGEPEFQRLVSARLPR
jgi:DNA-binding winged helix-turn-helix (wHTH) protein/tetratricopeptide (TPR) repeat protein/TolB-like protein